MKGGQRGEAVVRNPSSASGRKKGLENGGFDVHQKAISAAPYSGGRREKEDKSFGTIEAMKSAREKPDVKKREGENHKIFEKKGRKYNVGERNWRRGREIES